LVVVGRQRCDVCWSSAHKTPPPGHGCLLHPQTTSLHKDSLFTPTFLFSALRRLRCGACVCWLRYADGVSQLPQQQQQPPPSAYICLHFAKGTSCVGLLAASTCQRPVIALEASVDALVGASACDCLGGSCASGWGKVGTLPMNLSCICCTVFGG
jgi:hypothetical protein